MAALPRQIAHAKANAPAFARLLADVDPRRGELARGARASCRSRASRSCSSCRRRAGRSAASRAAARAGGRVFASPGPIYEPEGRGRTTGGSRARCTRRAFAPGDLVHNCFSYHFTPAGSMLEDRRARARLHGVPRRHRADRAAGAGDRGARAPTATSARRRSSDDHATRRDELGVAAAVASTKALVSGEAVPAAARDALTRAASPPIQVYATADLGLDRLRNEAREGLVVDEGVLVEIVRPGTGDPVPPGEVGEVVVTTLFNPDYPLIRFGTGDLSAFLPGTSAVRPHQHAHQGLDGPRRPDHQGQGHVRPSVAGRRHRPPPSGDREGAARRRQSRTATTG